MCCLWPAGARDLEADHPGWICLRCTHTIKQLWRIRWQPDLLGLGLLQQSLEQRLIPPASVKGVVFGDGLPRLACPPFGYLRIPALGLVPLFVSTQTEYFFLMAPAVSIIGPACGLRSHHVILGAPCPLIRLSVGQISDESTINRPRCRGEGVYHDITTMGAYIIEDEDEENTACLDEKRIHHAPSPRLFNIQLFTFLASRHTTITIPPEMPSKNTIHLPFRSFLLLGHWAFSALQWRDIGFLATTMATDESCDAHHAHRRYATYDTTISTVPLRRDFEDPV